MARKKTEVIEEFVTPSVVVPPPVVAPAVETVEEKREKNLDILFPPAPLDTGEASTGAVLVSSETTPTFSNPSIIETGTGLGEQKAKLTDIIDSLRRELRERIPGMNTLNTKDGSQFGVNIHNTRLVRGANALDDDLKSFADFLIREGLDNA